MRAEFETFVRQNLTGDISGMGQSQWNAEQIFGMG
jgi:hypothetical protein